MTLGSFIIDRNCVYAYCGSRAVWRYQPRPSRGASPQCICTTCGRAFFG